MEKKITWLDAITLLLWALPPLYLLSTYPSLPSQMPMHFDINGNPDRMGSKQEFLLIVLGMSILGLGVALLVRFAPRIDPKKKAQYSPVVFIHISEVVLLLMTVITGLVAYSGTKSHFALRPHLILTVIAVFFSVLGSMLGKVKPNYFVGIRTPWTLENDEVWKKTHRLAARIWLPGGAALAILTLLLHGSTVIIVYVAAIFLLAMIPVVYSYIYYRRIAK